HTAADDGIDRYLHAGKLIRLAPPGTRACPLPHLRSLVGGLPPLRRKSARALNRSAPILSTPTVHPNGPASPEVPMELAHPQSKDVMGDLVCRLLLEKKNNTTPVST